MDSEIQGYFTVFDISGRILYSNYLDEGSNIFTFNENFKPGVYYYSIIERGTDKVVKSGLIPVYK